MIKRKEADSLEIWAGPCSINRQNVSELYAIAELTTKNIKGETIRAIRGTRIVGEKSRTNDSRETNSIGLDIAANQRNADILQSGGTINDFEIPPSVAIATEFIGLTGLMMVTEITDPWIQMPTYQLAKIPSGQALFWNPAVQQLGRPVEIMSRFASANGWDIGLKNGKWLGAELNEVENPERGTFSPMENVWAGLFSYVSKNTGRVFIIERGVDVPGKGKKRNAETPEATRRVKAKLNCHVAIDTSHLLGGNFTEEEIIEWTIDRLHLRDNSGFLYDALLIEAGTSTTDTNQHISVDGLGYLANEVAKFRPLASP